MPSSTSAYFLTAVLATLAITFPAAEAATLAQINSGTLGFMRDSGPGPTAAVSHEVLLSRGPTRASATANSNTGLVRAKATQFGSPGGGTAGQTFATARMDGSFTLGANLNGATLTAQLYVDFFSDDFGIEVPGGNDGPGSALFTQFASTGTFRISDLATGQGLDIGGYGAQHRTDYMLTTDAGAVTGHTERFTSSNNNLAPNGSFVLAQRTTFSRQPSTIGLSALVEVDFVASSLHLYTFFQSIEVGTRGSGSHGVTANGNRSGHVGLALSDGASFQGIDGFLSEVSSLDLNTRLNLNGEVLPPVPLPAPFLLLGSALAALGWFRRKFS